MTSRHDRELVEIAISGLACRLPGASDPAEFWRLLSEERVSIAPIPPDRWNARRFLHPDRRMAGRSYTMSAGLIDGIWEFDPGFFGISAREAAQMDPQQRILLEVAYEAIDAACLKPEILSEGRTGVYVGASSMDHSQRFAADPAAIGAQFMTGNTLSILSNRISHAFDLKGPSYTVDTACSSSFYALDHAVRALADGEIDTAIVGGVNAILQPYNFVGFSRASMLSPTGLCRAFDAAADGYVRAEGAVALVLRRLESARAEGEPVRAVLMGTGVNSDGRTMGLALPSGERQAALLETVYRRLGIEPDRLAFIEAHGTGTPVGDPIEAHAIGKVLGKGRARPLPIGSAKSNVGHLEPASGLVGLIKAALALENGTVPRSLHVEQVNPHIPLDDLGLQVATEALPVPPHPDGAPWVAGINNFGFGGANAHAVLREALPAERPASPPEPLTSQASLPPLILTAASGESLARQAAAWSARVAGTSAAEATALIATAAHRQARHRHRAVVLGDTVSALVTELDSLGAGTSLVNTAVATAADRAGQTAFVFSGNGAQWPGMGCDLYAGDAAFRAAFDRVADAFRAQSGTDDPTSDLADLLQDPELGARIEESEVAQPLIFAIQVALVEALAGRGVRPDAVAGHSVGEVAAAWAAGALSLEDAVRLIRVRARAVRPLAGRGGMAAVLASAETVQGMLDELGMQAEISVAGDNSPRSVTICGDADALDRFGHSARKRRIAVRRLAVAYPYHGPAIDEIRDELLSGLAELAPRPAKLAFVSTTTGARAEGECLGATHWWHNARDAVRFRGAVGALDEVGCTVFVEIGPRPVLPSYVGDTLDGLGRAGAVLGTIEGPGKSATIDMMAARAVACGARVDAERFFGPPLPARHDRPAYSWDHATHRVPATSEELDVLGSAIDHPLLGWRPWHGEGTWRAQLDVASLPWLGDHAIEGSAVMPAAGFAEIALAAGAESLGTRALELSDFDIVSPLVFEAPGLVTLRTELERETGIVRIESRPSGSTDDWRLHARGTIRRAPGGANLPLDDATDDAAPVGRLAWTGERLYRMLAQAGLEYGPAFQLVTSLSADGPGAISELAEADAAPGANFVLHPASLDAAFHALFPLVGRALREQGLPEEGSFLPIRLGRLTTFAQPEPAEAGSVIRHAQVELVRLTEYGAEAAITLGNAQQTPIARIEGMRLRRVRSRRRLRDTPIAWAETLVPLAEPGAAVPVPDGWSAPRERLHGLGIIPEADQAPEPDAGALIADAAARRIAWDAVESLAGASRQIDRNGGSSVHPSARSLFARVAGVLEADGGLLAVASDTMTGEPETETKAAVTPSSGVLGLARDCPYPPLDALIEALIAEAPERAADLASLTRLAACLEPALRDGLDDDARAAAPGHLASHAPARRALWAAIERMGLDLGGSWPMGDRLALLVLGDVPPDVAARLAGLPGLTRLVLSDPEREVSERLALALSSQTATRVAHWDALEGPFDVVLSGDALWRVDNPARARLSAVLAPGGILAAVEGLGDLVTDLEAGLAAAWWNGASSGGPRHGKASLARSLTAAGLKLSGPWPLDRSETAAMVAVARRPVTGAAATKVDGLDTTGTEDQHPTDVAPPPRAALHHAASAPEEAAAYARELSQLGWQVRLVAHPPSAEDDAAAAIGLSCEGETAIVTPWPTQRQGGPDPRIELCRRLAVESSDGTPIWLLTRGGRPAERTGQPAAPRRPSDAALWGLGRVIANEFPACIVRQIDIDPALDSATAGPRLARLIAAPGPERELVIDGDGVAAPRLGALGDPTAAAADARAGAEGCRRLALGREGAVDTLHWASGMRRAPADHEVEIEVAATGLNFRDLMWAQRLLPPEALEDGFAGPTLGMECAGIVTRAGKASGFDAGTRVVAFAPAAFASHVTLDATFAAALPEGVSLEAAAGLPAIFLTAHYGLVELAGLSEGESVLIHGAAGGVGLAAIQVARMRGARVFATAGRPAKRKLVTLMGAEAVFDSRSHAFAEQVRAATGGRGVDVVLNSLAGEAMQRSVDCLAPFGRFVELGKQDYVTNTRLGLRPFRRNLSYFGVDADQLVQARPALTSRIFTELMRGFASGKLTPPPVQVFEPGEAADAFRLMQRSDHVGKIVIRPAKPPQRTAPPPREAVSGKGSWLIVGGLGGFGLATALWLARQGARRLWLTSRKGVPQPGSEGAIAKISALGARVEPLAVDACDREAMETLIARIRAEGSPLEGVIHAAMVLDDAPFAELSPERVAKVMRPKVEAAALLDRLVRPLAPRHFVLYSSISVAFGNPGQAAYVAANAAIEAIAANRRAEGLPGLAIAWGPISDQGYLARAEAQRAFIERRLDGALLAANDALEGLGALLADPEAGPVVRYAPMRWSSLAGDLPLIDTPLFERVDRTRRGAGTARRDFVAEIAGLDDTAARARIVEALTAECARILRQPEASIDPHRPLASLGFDSLMAVDLKMSAEEELGISLPITTLGDQMSLADLSGRVLERLRAGGASDDTDTDAEATVDRLRAQHGDTEVSDRAAEEIRARAERIAGAK